MITVASLYTARVKVLEQMAREGLEALHMYHHHGKDPRENLHRIQELERQRFAIDEEIRLMTIPAKIIAF